MSLDLGVFAVGHGTEDNTNNGKVGNSWSHTGGEQDLFRIHTRTVEVPGLHCCFQIFCEQQFVDCDTWDSWCA